MGGHPPKTARKFIENYEAIIDNLCKVCYNLDY